MFFDNSYGLLRILIVTPLAYIALVVMLRVSGKRTLSKMNAFDFIVTIALGSTLASTLLAETTALLEGILAMGLLVLLQYVITWLSVRSDTISGLVKADPTLLYHMGHYLNSEMKINRITRSEVQAAVRETGNGTLDEIVSVVLETDGTFSVISSTSHQQDRPIGVPRPNAGLQGGM